MARQGSSRKWLSRCPGLMFCALMTTAAVGRASDAQEVRFGGSDVSQRTVSRLPIEQNSNYTAVKFLFDHLLDSYDQGDFIYHQHLQMLEVEPGSEAARIVTEAILAWRTLVEARPIDRGLQGQAMELAGRESLRRSVRELRTVYRRMLRELTKVGNSTEPIELEIEELRRSTTSTVYGGTQRNPEAQRILDSFDEPDAGTLP